MRELISFFCLRLIVCTCNCMCVAFIVSVHSTSSIVVVVVVVVGKKPLNLCRRRRWLRQCLRHLFSRTASLTVTVCSTLFVPKGPFTASLLPVFLYDSFILLLFSCQSAFVFLCDCVCVCVCICRSCSPFVLSLPLLSMSKHKTYGCLHCEQMTLR